jgi:large subunit ribosomal protein L43
MTRIVDDDHHAIVDDNPILLSVLLKATNINCSHYSNNYCYSTPRILLYSTMATRGVFQLTKLKLIYCEHGGSSKHVREFLSTGKILDWAAAHPSVQVEVLVRNGNHPFVEGEYVTGLPKQIGVKNIEIPQLTSYMKMLYNSSGRKIKRLAVPVVTSTPTIQGIWSPMLDLGHAPFPNIKIVD